MVENDPPSKKDFFISYNKADREWAEWIAWQLEASGYSVAIQAWDFGVGSSFPIEMDRAICECKRVVAVISPDYLTSKFTRPEWAAYFSRDPSGDRRLVVPIRVRECELKGLLAPIVHADVFGLSEEDAKVVLLQAVKVERLKPGKLSRFPGFNAQTKPRFPNVLPEVWNVPHLRNPNFTEPGQRLSDLRDALCSGTPAALTQLVAGLGGVGKTQLATEYAYRYIAHYNIVWWLHSEEPSTLAAEYAALARKLDLPEKDAAEQSVVIAAVRDALQQRPDWLLVFDNANAAEEIRSYVPSIGGHVLVTSRNPAWGGLAHVLLVKEWEPNIAVEFLLKRAGKSDADTAKDLAQELGYLPLALEQAAAYIDSTQTAFMAYLALFRERRLATLETSKPGTDYYETVGTTWDISFRRLEVESPGGAALLQLCAFFAPDNIPRDVIAQSAVNLPAPLNEIAADDLAFDDAVRAIRRYSLIEVGEALTLSIHRLVQAVVRDRLDPPARQGWSELAVKVINEAFPFESDDVRTWKECDRLLPHAINAAELAESLNVGFEPLGRLVNQIALYAWGHADYKAAEKASQRALDMAEKTFGTDHPLVATRVSNQGIVLMNLGNLNMARTAFERAVQIAEKHSGLNHPTVAAFLNNLGTVLRDIGDFVGARAALERALRIDEAAYGIDHPNVARDVNNLAFVLQTLGDLPSARAAYERALKIFEKDRGPDHPAVATLINNLGSVLQALGDMDAAREAFEQALEINERNLGRDHPAVATSINNLGTVLRNLGDSGGAKVRFERALSIDEKLCGPNHPNVARDANNLGGVLEDLGDLAGAKASYERAIAVDEKVFGLDHWEVAIDLNNLGGVLRALDDGPGAKAAYDRALKILQKSLGEDHPTTLMVRKNLDSLLR